MTGPAGTNHIRSNTMIVCGTIILLACIGAVLYLSSTNAPNVAALGIIGTIIASVLAGTFGLAKLSTIERKVDQAVHQTNGGLDDRIYAAVQQALTTSGQPPLTGPGSAGFTP